MKLFVLTTALLPALAFGATQWKCVNDKYVVKIGLDRSGPIKLLSIEQDGVLSEGPAMHLRLPDREYDGYSLNGGQSVFWVMPSKDDDAKWEPCSTCVVFQCSLSAR